MTREITGAVGVALLVGILALTGCQSDAQTGAAVGGLAGAGLGQAIGRDTGSTLIGAGAGAVGGYMIGNEMDKAKAARERQSIREEAIREANTQIVLVRNSNGSYTRVTLHRSGGHWIGPNGEEYMSLPTEEQLRPVYGF